MNTDLQTTTKIRPHVVLTRKDGDLNKTHALSWTDGPFAGMVFTYNSIKFVEDKERDKLVIKFDYTVLEIPDEYSEYSTAELEKNLGDFIIELLYYGLERDMLGFTDFKYDDILNMPEEIDSGFTMA